ncbi:MAG: hypothetical protein AAFN77_00915 [Planctomycetota bacterium]
MANVRICQLPDSGLLRPFDLNADSFFIRLIPTRPTDMPVTISCPHCQKRYNLPDTIVGKSVRCKQCSQPFVATPGVGQPVAVGASAPPKTATRDQLSSQQINQFGIEGNIERKADIFGVAATPAAAPTLGNFAGEDPGFGGEDVEIPTASPTADSNENPYAAVLNNPALRKQKSKKKDKAGKQLAEAERIREEHIEHEVGMQQWGMLLMIGAVISLLFAISSLFTALFADVAEAAVLFFIVAGTFGAFGIFQFIAGWGMRQLENYGRICATILAVLGLAGFGLGTIFSIYLLYSFWCAQGNMVFSDRYKKIIKMTPHIQYNSILIYILVVCFIFLPAIVAFFSFLIGGMGAFDMMFAE